MSETPKEEKPQTELPPTSHTPWWERLLQEEDMYEPVWLQEKKLPPDYEVY